MNIGTAIKAYRTKAEMTQLELADSLGVTQGLIAQFERGSKIPSMILGASIAKALHCTIDELYEGGTDDGRSIKGAE